MTSLHWNSDTRVNRYHFKVHTEGHVKYLMHVIPCSLHTVRYDMNLNSNRLPQGI